MERLFEIRSDIKSLKTLQKLTIKNYIKGLFHINKKWAIGLLFVIGLGTLSYSLTGISWNFIVITAFSVLGVLFCFIVICTIVIKHFFIIRKYNIHYEKFIRRYSNTPIIYYHLKEDTLNYKGESEITYNWSEFLGLREDEDSFWLITDTTDRNIWIPKLAMVNPEDYCAFKAFAANRINLL